MSVKKAYTITDARYSKSKKVIQVHDGRDGLKGRAAYLAEALGGRWVHRSHGYVVSPTAAEKFERLFKAGFDANLMVFTRSKALFYHTNRNIKDLTAAQALKEI